MLIRVIDRRERVRRRLCLPGQKRWFGVTEALAVGLGSLGLGTTAAGIGADALLGAGLGAAGSAITGGKPLTGALTGGLTGGAIGGFGGPLGDALGIGATAGDALAGAGAGALGAGLTGGNPLTGAATGGASGLATGLLGDLGASAAPGPSAASTASPLGATAPPVDLTGGFNGGAMPGGSFTLAENAPASSVAANLSDLGGASASTDPFAVGGDLKAATGGTVSIPDAVGATTAGGWTTTNAAAPGILGTLAKDTGVTQLSEALGVKPATLLGTGIAAGGLGFDLLRNNAQPGVAPLTQQAGQLASQGQQLQSYLTTGTLPPGAQTAVSQAAESAKAEIRSKYAAMGASGSTMEAQALAAVDQNVATQTYTIANQLLQSGISETQLSSEIYNYLLNNDNQQNQVTTQAVANLASALSGAPTIKIG